MPPAPPLSRQLPLRFANGQTVSRFAKHCPRCRHVVGSEHMHGEVRLVQDRIVIAAKATCPQCDFSFGVTCIITDDKEVHHVALPNWILAWWLRRTLPTPLRDDREARAWRYEAPKLPAAMATPASTEADSPPAAGLPLPDVSRFVASEEAVGRYQDQPIPAWLMLEDVRYAFHRIATVGSPLADGEVLFQRSLIYRRIPLNLTA